MNNIKAVFTICFILIFLTSCKGQKTFGVEQLKLKSTIELPSVSGRIDHLDVNLKEQIVYVAALGNNSLEVVDIKNGKLLHSIKGLDEPQGVGYIPQTHEIMVANGGDGSCRFYNAATFEETATFKLGNDADDVRYDSMDRKIFVGYGNGAIAIIDATSHQKITDIKLAAHPEGFQLDKALNKLFVNVPDADQIDVIDLKESKLADKWKTEYGSNFPMTVDAAGHILFIGYRHPGKLVAINAETGKTISTADLVADIDDLYYDEATKKVYASGGGGAINIFQFQSSELRQIANISSRSGARTSLLIPSMKIFILAERASGNQTARLKVFNLSN